MTTLLRAADSAELLALVPVLAGFTPRRSLVLLPFRGSRTHGAMRLDLPSPDVDPGEYADLVVGLVSRVEHTDAIAIVVYSDDPPQHTPDGLLLPLAAQLDDVLGCAGEAGLRIVDALCVTPEGWSSYLDDDPQLSSLTESEHAVLPDIDVSGDQSSGTELPAVDLAEKERVGRALHDISALLDDEHLSSVGGRNPQVAAALAALDDVVSFFETLLECADSPPTYAVAALLWCMDRPVLRDVALMQWATDESGGERTLDAQLTFLETGAMAPDSIGDLFFGRGAMPDADRLRLALSIVRSAAARAPRTYRRGPLTVAAWLSWALGRATHAEHYLALVREIDPEYGLAALLSTMIDAAVLPEWAFRRGAGL